MNPRLRFFVPVCFTVALATIPGCTTTFETSTNITTAPFELTSSTSGTTPYPHGPTIQAERFVTHNFENLKHDMAQSRGEYIDSLGTLLGIPGQDLPEFAASMQESHLMSETMTPQAIWKVLSRDVRTWPMSGPGYAQ
jgi:hypothetical protein